MRQLFVLEVFMHAMTHELMPICAEDMKVRTYFG